MDIFQTGMGLAGYSPIADIASAAVCLVMVILVWQTNVHKSENFRRLQGMLILVLTAAVSNIIMAQLILQQMGAPILIYILRVIHCVSLAAVLILYVQYLYEPMWIRKEERSETFLLTAIALIIAFFIDIIGTKSGFGFVVTDGLNTQTGFDIYSVLYVVLLAFSLMQVFRYRTRIIGQVFWGITGISFISIVLLVGQILTEQTSFYTTAYFLPILGVLFLFHSNPYDTDSGAASENAFFEELGDAIARNQPLLLISLYAPGFTHKLKQSNMLRLAVYQYIRQYVRRGILFQLANDRMILVIQRQRSIDNDALVHRAVEKLYENFKPHYNEFQIDYKICAAATSPLVAEGADYIRLFEYLELRMQMNTLHYVEAEDISDFYDSNYILRELEDIARKRDFNDPRVMLYCQPVLNLQTGMYDTAEALMRLNLEKKGVVYPDQFIPLAEQNGLIHMLTMIILHKTCGSIAAFLERGYILNRISVNFTVSDLRCESLFIEVKEIIRRNNIPCERVAVEITESQSDADFQLMKQRILELKDLGIKFYLDDFGTGYSNFERIMELPFDIIKFDRSMVVESEKNTSSHYMVSTFATMFKNLNYSVLYEGVENEQDELHCRNMSANYLQGYRYSKPIPIEQLVNFLSKSE